LEIGYKLGANKNEIRIVFLFVCIRRVKATKMSKSLVAFVPYKQGPKAPNVVLLRDTPKLN
jgi:hypothetical protein